jgi:hypothetical protein
VSGPSGATIEVDGEVFTADPARPFVFGRDDRRDVVGLDPKDMGISAVAGAIELRWDVWWLANRSTKRPLLLAFRRGAREVTVLPGDRHALTTARPTVLVPGAVYTHVLEIVLPEAYLAGLRQSQSRVTTGTGPIDGPPLSDADRRVLTALCRGYIESFPRRDETPRSYAEIAGALGPPWTALRVRKHIERIRERFAGAGLYFAGPQANHELACHLTLNGTITPSDLNRLCVPDLASR